MSLSIGRFAQLAKVSPRALRHYESLGLIAASGRNENGYRYYSRELLKRVERIRNLQSLGFTLEEVQNILRISDGNLVPVFQRKLAEVENELRTLEDRRRHLRELLSVANRMSSNEPIPTEERKWLMDAIQAEILRGLKTRCGAITEEHRKYLERDLGNYQSPERGEIVEAIKRCVNFANSRGLRLGPGRGPAPASLTLYGLGFGSVDPTRYDLIPERLETSAWDIHIDVEYERGLEFVEFCQKVNSTLSEGQIQAFRMPLIDITVNVHKKLGFEIDYDAIPDDSDEVLRPFKAGRIDKIFCFDTSPDTLLARVFRDPPEFLGPDRIGEYLRSQKIYSFRDVMNIMAVWRPSSLPGMPERIERYRQAKLAPFRYPFLTQVLQDSLKPNFGLVIYHEDIMRILKTYTQWSYAQCNQLRIAIYRKNTSGDELIEKLRQTVSPEIANLIEKESHQAFCFPHVVAFSRLSKQTALLMSRHRKIYLEAIDEFESKHGLRWDDIGVRWEGVSLLQL